MYLPLKTHSMYGLQGPDLLTSFSRQNLRYPVAMVTPSEEEPMESSDTKRV